MNLVYKSYKVCVHVFMQKELKENTFSDVEVSSERKRDVWISLCGQYTQCCSINYSNNPQGSFNSDSFMN